MESKPRVCKYGVVCDTYLPFRNKSIMSGISSETAAVWQGSLYILFEFVE